MNIQKTILEELSNEVLDFFLEETQERQSTSFLEYESDNFLYQFEIEDTRELVVTRTSTYYQPEELDEIGNVFVELKVFTLEGDEIMVNSKIDNLIETKYNEIN